MIGSVLDKYEVLQKVGEGGMATVYRGRHTTLDRDVAIKVLHPHLSSSTRNRKRFAREARAIEHLRHDNILEIFDYSGIDCSDCYIITEFVQGKTLTSLTEDVGQLPSELVSILAIELCAALEYAHSAGILHRDLKPENVMVRFDGRVKLMDFGIARFLDESQVTLTGALIGSPAFMSPEQAREGDLDQRSDLFSLGTVLFYLVTGGLPFTGSNPSLILKKVIEGDRPAVTDLCPEMSASLADVIERLLSTEPDGRFNDAHEVGTALRETLAEVDVDPADPRWQVSLFLRDPDGYTRDLDRHVRSVLLTRGRAHLQHGEALQALRLFNRLLSLDEGNEEVLALVQSLHAEPESPLAAQRRWVVAAAALGLMLLLATVSWSAWVAWNSATPAVPVRTAEPVPPTVPDDPAPIAIPGPLVPLPTPLVVEPETAPQERPAPLPTPVAPAPIRPAAPVPTARPTPPPDLEIPTGPATVRIRSNLTADVFLEGRRIGSTRSPLTLEPGAYVLQIRGDVVKPRDLRVEVGPGDEITEQILLEARPASIQLTRDFAEDCVVILDGDPRGTIRELDHVLEVPNPDRVGHVLRVTCAGIPDFVHVWSSVVFPGDRIGR